MWALTLSCLFVITWTQLGYWRNSIALCDHALKVTNHNDTIHTIRGVAYATLGNHGQAIEDFDGAIEINPRNMQRPITTVVLPISNWATTGRRSRIMTGLSRSILAMLRLTLTAVLPMANLATTGRRFQITQGYRD